MPGFAISREGFRRAQAPDSQAVAEKNGGRRLLESCAASCRFKRGSWREDDQISTGKSASQPRS